MAVVSELSDERFWGDAMSQALDTERAERLRLTKENKELQVSLLNTFLIRSLSIFRLSSVEYSMSVVHAVCCRITWIRVKSVWEH